MFVNFRKSKSAFRSFLILLIGGFFIQVAGVTVFTQYYNRYHHQVSRRQYAFELVRAIKLSQLLPIEELRDDIRVLDGLSLHVKLLDAPIKDAEVIDIDISDTKEIKKFAAKHYHKMRAVLQMENGQWLNIVGGVEAYPWVVMGAIISEIFLLIVFILLAVWVIGRVYIPANEFSEAVTRFGVDVNAPPVALQGSEEIQSIIAAFNQMQDRVRRLIEDRTQMLAAISHDLRTPITRLQLRIECLEGTPHYEKAKADLEEMDSMISSILSFARDHIRTEQMETFDFAALLELICNDLQDTGMDVCYVSDAERLPYFGRMIALKRAITNLIENAVKYGDKAEVTLSKQEQRVQIKIIDQGPGIAESERHKVFNPFYRIDSSRTPEKCGTGLGMAVARDIIRAHGGDIMLNNGEERGLIVLITLPLEFNSQSAA